MATIAAACVASVSASSLRSVSAAALRMLSSECSSMATIAAACVASVGASSLRSVCVAARRTPSSECSSMAKIAAACVASAGVSSLLSVSTAARRTPSAESSSMATTAAAWTARAGGWSFLPRFLTAATRVWYIVDSSARSIFATSAVIAPCAPKPKCAKAEMCSLISTSTRAVPPGPSSRRNFRIASRAALNWLSTLYHSSLWRSGPALIRGVSLSARKSSPLLVAMPSSRSACFSSALSPGTMSTRSFLRLPSTCSMVSAVRLIDR